MTSMIWGSYDSGASMIWAMLEQTVKLGAGSSKALEHGFVTPIVPRGARWYGAAGARSPRLVQRSGIDRALRV